jgi:nitrite reductase/ring-hydroxylating ferredoxin subunit
MRVLHYSIRKDVCMNIDRRGFLKIGGCAFVCTCVSAAGAGLCEAAQPFGVSATGQAAEGSISLEGNTLVLDLLKNSALKTPGGSIKLSAKNNTGIETKILVLCSDNGIYKAAPNKCTHGGMELEYKHAEKLIRCVSFGKSEFDLTGKVLKGPAPTPLKMYSVSVNGNKLFIALT